MCIRDRNECKKFIVHFIQTKKLQWCEHTKEWDRKIAEESYGKEYTKKKEKRKTTYHPVSYTHLDVYKRQAEDGVYTEDGQFCGLLNWSVSAR